MLARLIAADLREMAVFAFTAKTLARSPLQRPVLTAFVALAAALICNSFAGSLALSLFFLSG